MSNRERIRLKIAEKKEERFWGPQSIQSLQPYQEREREIPAFQVVYGEKKRIKP
jgi:hypothetical protein